MFWVSPWRTTAVDEDSNDCKDGDSHPNSEVETESLSREWESQPKPLQDENDWDTWSDSDVDIYMGEEEYVQEKWLKTDRDYEGDWEEEADEEEEEEWDSLKSTEYLHALRGLFPVLKKGQLTNDSPWGSEPELEYLRDGESGKLCVMSNSADTTHTCVYQFVYWTHVRIWFILLAGTTFW